MSIESGREDEGIAYLHANVLPAMKQIPGLVSGYWLASKEGHALTVLVFDQLEAAEETAGGLARAPRPDFATLGKIEVRDVVVTSTEMQDETSRQRRGNRPAKQTSTP